MTVDLNSIEKRSAILVILALIILCLVIYWPMQNLILLILTTTMYIIKNSYVQAGFTLDGLRWVFSTKYFGLWNPSGVAFLYVRFSAFWFQCRWVSLDKRNYSSFQHHFIVFPFEKSYRGYLAKCFCCGFVCHPSD